MPFLFGLLIGPVGLWIRRYMGETEAFLEAIREPGERQGCSACCANTGAACW